MMFCLASSAGAEHIEKMFSSDVLAHAPTFASCANVYSFQSFFTKDTNKKKEMHRLKNLNFKTSVYLYAVEGWIKGDRPANREKGEIKSKKIFDKRTKEWNKVFKKNGYNQGSPGRNGFNKQLSDCNKNQVARKFYLPKLESVMEDTVIIKAHGEKPVTIPLGPIPFYKQK